MSRYIFLFGLDAIVTKEEIFPAVSKELGVYEKMSSLTENSMRGELPSKQSFMRRASLFMDIPVWEVRKLVGKVTLNEKVAQFIKENRERCYIITENLDVWIEDVIKALNMEGNVFCSKALVKDDYILDVVSVIDKNTVVKWMRTPFVAVGSGNNEAEIIEAAEIGIGFGKVREIAPSVLTCASHVVYDEEKLVDFLERLL